MNFSNFIVLDDKVKTEGTVSRTVNGTVFVPLESSVPVIVRGSGCIGLAYVLKITLTASSTEITFKMNSVSKETANVLYNLYRNQLSNNDADDPYDSADAIIPGMAARLKPSSNSFRDDSGYSRRARRTSSILDDLDDDYRL